VSKAEVISTAAETATAFEKAHHGCAQCVLAGIMKAFDIEAPEVFKASTGFSGGMGCTGRTCGALTGGILSIGLFVGRDLSDLEDAPRRRWQNFALVKDLIERYEATFGSLDCRDVQQKVVGLSIDLWNREEAKRFGTEYDGHNKCAEGVVGVVAGWTAQILLDYLDGVSEVAL